MKNPQSLLTPEQKEALVQDSYWDWRFNLAQQTGKNFSAEERIQYINHVKEWEDATDILFNEERQEEIYWEKMNEMFPEETEDEYYYNKYEGGE